MKVLVGVILGMLGLCIFADIVLANAEAMPVISEGLWKMIIEKIGGSLGVDNFVATYLVVMTGLRAIAEGGGYLANKSGAKWDNIVVKWFAKSLNAVSWAAGLFGIGTPKNTTKPEIKLPFKKS